MLRTQTEQYLRVGVTYRVETTWDDETGNAEIREFDQSGILVRRCEWSISPENEQRDDAIGEAVWFDPRGAELERRSLRQRPYESVL